MPEPSGARCSTAGVSENGYRSFKIKVSMCDRLGYGRFMILTEIHQKAVLRSAQQLRFPHKANGPCLHRKNCAALLSSIESEAFQTLDQQLHSQIPLTHNLPDFPIWIRFWFGGSASVPSSRRCRCRSMWAWPTTIGSRCSPGTSKRSAPTPPQVRQRGSRGVSGGLFVGWMLIL